MKLNLRNLVLSLFTTTILLPGLPACTPGASTQNASSFSSQEPQQQEVKIAGSSSTFPIMKVLLSTYTAKFKTTKINFAPPGQSETTIAGVKEGIFDIAAISKQVKPEERDSKLDYYEICKDGLLVATHPSVTSVTNLTKDNLKAIYSGKIKNWKELGGPDAKIVVLDRPEDESAKKLLRKHYLGEDLKNSKDAVLMRKENDLITAIQNTQYSIGAFSLGYAVSNQLAVNRLQLDGVEPTADNIRKNKYKMIRAISLVAQKNPKQATKEIIDFALSAEGKKILSQSGFVPTN